MDVNFFKKKFYGQTNSALLSLSDESWNGYIKQLYMSEVARSGRSFMHEDYVDANIRDRVPLGSPLDVFVILSYRIAKKFQEGIHFSLIDTWCILCYN